MSAGFAYVQSRVQARFGELIDDSAWQRLDAARSMSGFLEEKSLFLLYRTGLVVLIQVYTNFSALTMHPFGLDFSMV